MRTREKRDGDKNADKNKKESGILKQMPRNKPDQKMIEYVADYKRNGLKNREIGRILKRDEKQIRRWVAHAKTQKLI